MAWVNESVWKGSQDWDRANLTNEYNRRHAVKELSNLSPGDRVYIPDRKENAVVVAKTPEPRCYYLHTDGNATVRRNRRQLNPDPKEAKYTAGSPLPDSPETSKDRPPVLAEKKDALRSAQNSSIPVPVPIYYSFRKKSQPAQEIRFWLGLKEHLL